MAAHLLGSTDILLCPSFTIIHTSYSHSRVSHHQVGHLKRTTSTAPLVDDSQGPAWGHRCPIRGNHIFLLTWKELEVSNYRMQAEVFGRGGV